MKSLTACGLGCELVRSASRQPRLFGRVEMRRNDRNTFENPLSDVLDRALDANVEGLASRP